MKEEKGITLVSLVIYVILMIIVTGIMGGIVTTFYDNTEEVIGNVQETVEFNKFNIHFLKEIKAYDNEVDHIDNDGKYILFTSGNSFSLSNNAIYYNDKKVCDGVKSMNLAHGLKDGTISKDIIDVTLEFKNFKKNINYKVENIY